MLFAATYPQLTRAVVTFGAHPTTFADEDYPCGITPGPPARRVIREDVTEENHGLFFRQLAPDGGVGTLGLQVRIGLHAGEYEIHGDDVGGIAVHIAARVMAGAGEIRCSRTVKDLTAGSGLAFEDLGEHLLKGVPSPGSCSASSAESR